MRLLCDEMLLRLGRWLRAAGYDTEIAGQGMPDGKIIAMARRESRLLITRDRKMTEHGDAAGVVLVLEGKTLHDCVRELSLRLEIDWLQAPFTRCLLCNTPLVKAGADVFSHIPLHSRRAISEAFYCPGCTKPFWHGGHVRRMRARLESWNTWRSALPPPDTGKHRTSEIMPEAEQGAGQGRKRRKMGHGERDG